MANDPGSGRVSKRKSPFKIDYGKKKRATKFAMFNLGYKKS